MRIKMLNSKQVEENFNPFSLGVLCIILLLIFYNFFPGLVPLPWVYWVENRSSLLKIITSAWPVFSFGIIWTAFFLFTTENKAEENHNAENKLLVGVLISMYAGVIEESLFRWLVYLISIGGLRISDWVFGGFIFGTGFVNWLYTTILIPFTDVLTFGQLTDYLYNPLSWAVGGAIISTNWRFTKGHAYQGLVCFIDSWFFGMFMFKVVWECGLLSAIMVHVAYDVIIFALLFIDRKVEFLKGNK